MLVNSLCANDGHYFPEKTMRTKNSGYTSSAAYCAVENEFAAFSAHTLFERVANASKKKKRKRDQQSNSIHVNMRKHSGVSLLSQGKEYSLE